ncbi:hypothetical protein [Halovenus salina]|nr:hypothetical protein [Halovenus salina]
MLSVSSFTGAVAAANHVDESELLDVEIDSDDRTVIDGNPTYSTEWEGGNASNVQSLNDGPYNQRLILELNITSSDAGQQEIILNYSESEEIGIKPDNVSVGSGPLSGQSDTIIRTAEQEVAIQFDSGDVSAKSATQNLTIDWIAPGELPETDEIISHEITLKNTTDDDYYRFTNVGLTGIHHNDSKYKSGDTVSSITYSRNGDNGAFRVWGGQTLTVQAENNSKVVSIREFETTSGGEIILGDIVDRMGTVPGPTANFEIADDLNSTKERVVQIEDPTNIIPLQFQPLNLETNWSTDKIESDDSLVLDVNSADLTGTDINATIFDSNQTVVNTTTTSLNASGDASIAYTPDRDLNGPGEYQAVVEHNQSGVTSMSNSTTVIEPLTIPDNLSYSFEIPNDGEVYSVGLPGATNGTLADMMDPDAEGYTVYTWDNGDWSAITDFESQTFEGLDAFIVATEGGQNQPDSFSVDIEFTEQSAATPPQADLDEGWNFVSAPKFGDVDTVFGISDAFLVLDRFNEPQSELIQSVDQFGTHYIGEDDNQVSPFKGYFVFVEDDATLPGVLSGAETRDELEEQLGIIIQL